MATDIILFSGDKLWNNHHIFIILYFPALQSESLLCRFNQIRKYQYIRTSVQIRLTSRKYSMNSNRKGVLRSLKDSAFFAVLCPSNNNTDFYMKIIKLENTPVSLFYFAFSNDDAFLRYDMVTILLFDGRPS